MLPVKYRIHVTCDDENVKIIYKKHVWGLNISISDMVAKILCEIIYAKTIRCYHVPKIVMVGEVKCPFVIP